jgi:hypothetical protein
MFVVLTGVDREEVCGTITATVISFTEYTYNLGCTD